MIAEECIAMFRLFVYVALFVCLGLTGCQGEVLTPDPSPDIEIPSPYPTDITPQTTIPPEKPVSEPPTPTPPAQPPQPWQTAYEDVLKKYNPEAQIESSGGSNEGRFILHDVDKNGVPELFILANHGTFSSTIAAYTFEDGIAVKLELPYSIWFTFAATPPNNRLGMIVDSSDSGFNTYSLYILDNYKLTGEITVLHDYTASQDGSYGLDVFYVNNTEVSEAEYTEIFENYFDGVEAWIWPTEINDGFLHP
jgi:hypothetical protein